MVSLPVATALGNVGGNYAAFSVPAGDQALLNGITQGTRFIIALARAAAEEVTELAGEILSVVPTLSGDLTVGAASPTELAGEIRAGVPTLAGDLTVGEAESTELAGEIRSGAPTLAGDLTVAEGVPTELAGEIRSAASALTGELSEVEALPDVQNDGLPLPADLSGESLVGVRYGTRDGDSLDAVCWKHYGRQAGAVEAVLEANPGLSEAGPVLPDGFVIGLPDLPQPAPEIETVSLWD